jgi:hypothetical protein
MPGGRCGAVSTKWRLLLPEQGSLNLQEQAAVIAVTSTLAYPFKCTGQCSGCCACRATFATFADPQDAYGPHPRLSALLSSCLAPALPLALLGYKGLLMDCLDAPEA